MKFAVTLLLLYFCGSTQAQNHTPSWTIAVSPRDNYPYELIKLALDSTIQSHGSYQLNSYKKQHSFNRRHYMLEQGLTFQITSFGASQSVNSNLIAIEVPIYQGMLGFRLLATNIDSNKELITVQSLEELQALKAGFNNQWSDFPIFKLNELRVETASNFISLYSMLHYNRFDYLPRSIREIDVELERFKGTSTNLLINDTLALYYPHPVYFHVSPKYKNLAKRIEIGMNNILNNGTFKSLFLSHHAEIIDKHKPNQLNVIHLKRDKHFRPVNTHWWYIPNLK